MRTVGLLLLDEADGLTERLARVAGELVTDGCTGAAVVLLGASVSAGNDVAVAGLGVCSAGEVAGLNVATDSIAPATRHTARMLASSGMTLPRAAKGANGPGQPAQPRAATLGAQLPVVGQHVTLELARVIRDLDVERWLVPSGSAARIHRHLRRELNPSSLHYDQYDPRARTTPQSVRCQALFAGSGRLEATQ